jgi:outer membrane lipoprotein-sorting protein
MRTIVIITGLLLLACRVTLADTENLEEFLHNAEQAAQVATPLRGDGQFEVASGNGLRRDEVAMIVRPPTDMYVELRQEGIRALLLNEKGEDSRVKTNAGKPVEFPLDASFADSDFTREDLLPFRLASYKQPRISDESASDITITFFPMTPQYSLVVMTFDRDKKVPRKTLYYRDTLNNLVKLRRDDGYILVGRKWMPTVVSMETFKLRTHTSFNVRWSQDPQFPPELFDPVFLSRPSGILWPIAPTPPSTQ